MLDFTERKQKFWEVKLKDGEQLTVALPDGAFYERLNRLDGVETMGDIENLVAEILNRNTNKKTYDRGYVAKNFDVSELQAIIIDYKNTVNQVISNPN